MTDPRPLALNLGCGRRPEPSTPAMRWMNLDALPLPGVDRQLDLWQMPWPLADGSVDHIYSRFWLEHIPHALPASPASPQYTRLDGFFAVWAEIWRCLKMGGTTTHEVPWVLSFEASSDPSHTRAVTPQTLAYLCNWETTQQDYLLPFRFENAALPELGIDKDWSGTPEEAVAAAYHQFNVVHYWKFTLRKIPLARPEEQA